MRPTKRALRYMRVDPNNRLVADTLEAQWNDKLRLLTQAKEEYEKQRRLDAQRLTAEQKAKVLALASDFPKLWNDAKTPDRERKRMARLLLEDVTLRREEEVLVQVRFKGGATRELRLPLPQRAWELTQTNPEIVAAIDQLLEEHTGKEVAQLLNQRQWRSGHGLRLEPAHGQPFGQGLPLGQSRRAPSCPRPSHPARNG